MVKVYKIRSDDRSLALKESKKLSSDIFQSAGLKQVKNFFSMVAIKMWNSLRQDIVKNKGRNGFRQIYRKNKKSSGAVKYKYLKSCLI